MAAPRVSSPSIPSVPKTPDIPTGGYKPGTVDAAPSSALVPSNPSGTVTTPNAAGSTPSAPHSAENLLLVGQMY